LEQNLPCRKFRQVRQEGDIEAERETDHYNLDLIISAGYRVKSLQGTQFRIWATQRLKKYNLNLNSRELLTHAGKISHETAIKKSGKEFEKFLLTQNAMEEERCLNEIEADIDKLKKFIKMKFTIEKKLSTISLLLFTFIF